MCVTYVNRGPADATLPISDYFCSPESSLSAAVPVLYIVIGGERTAKTSPQFPATAMGHA